MSDASDEAENRVVALVERLRDAYLAHTRPRAILLVGSAVTGGVDGFSDVDTILYYDAVPELDELAGARAVLGAQRYVGTEWPDEGYSERYDVGGIHCQLGHALIEPWEREIAAVVDDLNLDARLVKQLMGLAEGRPLHGAELVAGWRQRAEYTDRVQRAMIEKHWAFFPWWYYAEKLARRDATVWRFDVLVQSSYNLIGVVAALNRVWYSTFELKRVRTYLAAFEKAPDDFAGRLERLFVADAAVSALELEKLVDEAGTLVRERLPEFDLSISWGGNSTPPGARERPWI